VKRTTRIRSWLRRLCNLKASESTKAQLYLILVYLAQDGLTIEGPLTKIPFPELTERQAHRLIGQGRAELRMHIASVGLQGVAL